MTLRDWTRHVLVPFAATRAGLLLVGVLALGLIGPPRAASTNLVGHEPAPLALEIWARWDSEWYLLIAEHGYRLGPFLADYAVEYQPADAAGFFPLYPMLLRALAATGLPAVAAGVAISNLALLAAVTLLWLLVKDETDAEIAAASVWALLSFPTSFFFSAVYSESLAFLFILGAFLAARRGKWTWLAIAGLLASLARPTGVLAGLAVAWEVRERRGGWRGWLSLAGFPAGTAAFSWFCYRTFGDPLAWAHRQARWRGAPSGPWRAFQRFFDQPAQLHGAHNSILEFALAVVFLAALVPVIRRYRPSWGTYAILSVLVPLCATLWSFGRLVLLTFPCFALVGAAAREHRQVLPAYLSVCLPLAGLLMTLFACGWWAG